MAANQNLTSQRRYIFNVDILIDDETNGRALEKLLHLLNGNDITDYRIKEGIELGEGIKSALHESIRKIPLELPDSSVKQPYKSEVTAAPQPATTSHQAAPSSVAADPHQAIWDQFQLYKENNTLVRLRIVKAKGIKLSVPCRILNVDPSTRNVSVYHVDEKQVYLFNINEIDDFAVS